MRSLINNRLAVVASLSLLCSGAAEDFRAAWIPSSSDCTTSEQLCDQMVALQEVGINRVYLDVWNQGKVYFASPTMEAAGLNTSVGDDRLRWASECDSFQGAVVAWFEYGLIAAYGSINNAFAEYAEDQGWILGQEGAGFVWLDVNSGALDFLAGIMADVVKGYEGAVKGVQLDDHFGQPSSLVTSSRQTTETMTAAAEKLSGIVRAAGNGFLSKSGNGNGNGKGKGKGKGKGNGAGAGMLLSLSPATLSTALNTYCVDWKAWAVDEAPPLFDEVVPQIYRSEYAQFAAELQNTLDTLYGSGGGDDLPPTAAECTLAVGLRLDGSRDATPWADLEEMLDLSANTTTPFETAGLSPSIWYSRGILETYHDELTAYFSAASRSLP